MQVYSDETRQDEPTALPDVEVFIGSEYGGDLEDEPLEASKYYYWYCFPGCLPDSEPIGPFSTENAAIEDARA